MLRLIVTAGFLCGIVLPVDALAQAASNGDPQNPNTHVDRQQAIAAARAQATEEAIPLTPEMIRRLGQRFRDNQRAEEAVTSEIATPATRPAINVSYAPGQQTSLIETVKGYPTAVSFFDSTGAPWPIAWNTSSNAANPEGSTNCSSSGGSGGAPSVEAVGFYVCVPAKGSNTIEITPLSLTPRGGLLVNLQGAPKPLSFLLVPGRHSYDDNLSVRVTEHGPNARLNIDTRPGAPPTGEPYMNDMLSGIAPASAVPLSVEGVSPDEMRAWRLGNETYIRTRYTLMSPAWDGIESGEGGVTLYALPNTPVVLLDIANRTVSASLKEGTP